jgi:y4mF family transcriptional regulator
MEHVRIASFIRYTRQRLHLSQAELARKSGVGLRFIRELEQGKESVRLDKVNQVLSLFGHTMAPVALKQADPYEMLLLYTSKRVSIELRNRRVLTGLLAGPVYENDSVVPGVLQKWEKRRKKLWRMQTLKK